MLSLSIILSLIPVSIAGGAGLPWCTYWAQQGIFRPECSHRTQPHWSQLERNGQHVNKPSWAAQLPQCYSVINLSNCARTGFCGSGHMCWVAGKPCCAPENIRKVTSPSSPVISTLSDQCPAPHTMGYMCNVKKAINWCNSDIDCHRTNSMQRCCATQCGYNVCVPIRPPVDIQQRLTAIAAIPNECPSLHSINISCNSPSGVSWCRVHTDCRSTSQQMRICCPTRCNYNVCLLKTQHSWVIA